ncbi:PREDICTED: protein canopy homolog 4-like [Priapulus caudatus]|uniref:Protein canopy homolog 4-like n=1 Tax=Priapulus caudatus TaxID=37621 RepID=A0ABM1E7I9_PRICU|nr:PREDICTED: protein canopy homolog 4-like [Priapulus caudatus]
MGRFGQQQKKAVKYNKSETRLIEVLDEVCDQVLLYKVHAERQGSLRYAKGESETMRTLKGLKAKGVKVELGIPDEMWDSPHAEISQVKKMCELMREEYEEDIENWFFYHDDEPLTKFLCSQKVLSKDEDGCLSETLTDEKSVDTPAKPKSKTKRKHRKGDDGRNGLKDEL